MANETCPLNGSIIYTTEEIEGLKFRSGTSLIITVVIPIIACFGLTFNFAFLFVVYRVSRMRTYTNLFLVQLSICDFSTLIFDTVRYLWIYIRSSGYDIQQGTSAGCTIFNFLFYFTYYVGVNFICLVAVERFIAICKPLKYRQIKGNFYATSASSACWILGFLLSVAALVPQDVVTICAKIPTDVSTTSSPANFTWIVFRSCQPSCLKCFHALYIADTVQFLLVFAVNVVMYIAIIRKLRKRSGERRGMAGSDLLASRVSRDVARMLIINGCAFFLLLGPYEIWNVILLIQDYTGVLIVSEGFLYWLSWLSRLCAPINFSINPLIYGCSNKHYQKAFVEVFGCEAFRKRKPGIDSQDTTIQSAT